MTANIALQGMPIFAMPAIRLQVFSNYSKSAEKRIISMVFGRLFLIGCNMELCEFHMK